MQPRSRASLLALLALAVIGVVVLLAATLPHGSPGTSPSATRKAVTLPPADGRFDYQIGGPYTPASDVEVVTRDWHVTPVAGTYTICYVDVFQTQPEAKAWWLKNHPDLLLHRDGALVEDPNWPGQYVIDTSTAAKRSAIAALETPWLEACAQKGFDAVEADNLDSWTRSGGLLDADDNLALAKAIVTRAHRLGLAASQKNAAVLGARAKQEAGFDFATAESCQVFQECDAYTDVYGDLVYEIEYTDEQGTPFGDACAARGDRVSIIERDRLVVPKGDSDYRYRAC